MIMFENCCKKKINIDIMLLTKNRDCSKIAVGKNLMQGVKMSSNGFQEKAECALGVVKDGKRVQNFIFKIVEICLPVLFILSIVLCVIVSLAVAIGFWQYGDIAQGILVLIFGPIFGAIGVCFSFYFIYVLKAIKDSTSCICKSSSCCGEDVEEVKPKATKKSTASKEQE